MGDTGKVVAIDASQAMLAEASKRAGDQSAVEFRQGDAHHLEFADNSFDACRCDRCFMHMADPRQALAEMTRVAKRGGRVLVYEVDFETFVIAAPDRPLARKIVTAWTDSFRNGWLGRYLPGFFRDQELQDIVTIPAVLRFTEPWVRQLLGPTTVDLARQAGTVTTEEATTWLAWLDAELATGNLFSTLTGFIVCGRKPS